MSAIFFLAIMYLMFLNFKWPETCLFYSFTGTIIPAFLLTFIGFGAGITFLGFVLTVMGVLIYRIRYNVKLFNLTLTEKLVLLLELIMIASLLYTDAPDYGERKVKLFLVVNILLVFATRVCSSREDLFPRLMAGLGWTGVVALLLFTTLYVVYKDVLTQGGRFGGVSGSGVNSLVLSWTGASAVVCASYLLIKQKKYSIIVLPIMIGGMVSMLATGSRGPFVALLFGGLISFLSFRRFLESIAIILVLGIVMVAAIYFFVPQEAKYRLVTSFDKNATEESGRSQLYREAFQQYIQNPVFGGGVGAFAFFTEVRPKNEHIMKVVYPHNIVLEFAAETGTIGVFILLIIFIVSFKQIIIIRKTLSTSSLFWEMKFVQWLFYIGFINSMVSFDMNDQRNLFFAFGLLAGISSWVKGAMCDDDLNLGYCFYESEKLACE